MRILIIDPYFPTKITDKRTEASFVVCDFASKWKAEHEIFVIRAVINFPGVVNWLLKTLKEPRYEARNGKFTINGIKGHIINFKKYPKSDSTLKEYKAKYDEIVSILRKEEFSLDVCLAHFLIPGYYIMEKIKEEFKCKTFLTLHNTDIIHLQNNKTLFNRFKNRIETIDGFGGRK